MLGPNRLIVRDNNDNKIYYVKRLVFYEEYEVIKTLKFFNKIITVTENNREYHNPVKKIITNNYLYI